LYRIDLPIVRPAGSQVGEEGPLPQGGRRGGEEGSSSAAATGGGDEKFANVVAIVDPPRAGLHSKVLHALRNTKHLNRLVYVSCNPKTLAENAVEVSG
jgi:hypothetical protein